MRTQAEWNVMTHMDRACGPTSAATRAAISPAAWLVKVMARIWCGATSRAASRYAIRWVSTRVFPEPAPAHDEQRAALVHDGSTLLRIESVEEGIYREGGHVIRVGGRADKSSVDAERRVHGTGDSHSPLPAITRTY